MADHYPLCEKIRDAAEAVFIAHFQDNELKFPGYQNGSDENLKWLLRDAAHFGQLVHDCVHITLSTVIHRKVTTGQLTQAAIIHCLNGLNDVRSFPLVTNPEKAKLARSARMFVQMQEPESDHVNKHRDARPCPPGQITFTFLLNNDNTGIWNVYMQEFPDLQPVAATTQQLEDVVAPKEPTDALIKCPYPACGQIVVRKVFQKHVNDDHGGKDIPCPEPECNHIAVDGVASRWYNHLTDTHDFYYAGDPKEFERAIPHLDRKTIPALQRHFNDERTVLRAVRRVVHRLEDEIRMRRNAWAPVHNLDLDSIIYRPDDTLQTKIVRIRAELCHEWAAVIAALGRELFHILIEDEQAQNSG